MPEFRAIVNVMLRRAILDPQGRAVEATLHRLGHGNVGDLRVGKRIELTLSGDRADVEAQLARIVERVLSNPVMEDATYELHDVAASHATAGDATGDPD
jgi:phosphoribosylformylglycinamidine synthase